MRKLVRERGVVVAIQGRRGVVLSRDGEFRQVKLTGPVSLGDEVYLPRPVVSSRLAQIAAVLVVMVMAGWWWQWIQLGPVVAYVSLDINPSLELGVDARWRVVDATGLNPVGAGLLAEVSYRGRHVRDVVAELVDRAVSTVASSTERMVLVTVTPAVEKAVPPGLLDSVTEAVHRKVTADVTVQALQTAPEVRDEGRKLGLSTGRMAAALAAFSRGIAVEIEVFQQEPLAQAAAGHGLKIKDLMEDISENRNWPQLVKEFRPSPPQGKEPGPPEAKKPESEPPGQSEDKQPGPPLQQPPGQTKDRQPGSQSPQPGRGNPNPGPPFKPPGPEDQAGDAGSSADESPQRVKIPPWIRVDDGPEEGKLKIPSK
ncbi:MAG: anti-sigma factor domain-containing protein [Bacillota bacterium]